MLVLAVHNLAETSAKVPFSMVVSVLAQRPYTLAVLLQILGRHSFLHCSEE